MMSEQEILARLPQVFTDALLDPGGKIESGLRFEDIDGLDSVATVRLFMSIETAFKIFLSPRETGKVASIGDLIALIQRKI